MEVQKSWDVGKVGCKRNLGPCECCVHPDSPAVGEDVAGPGDGVRANSGVSEEARFGWG